MSLFVLSAAVLASGAPPPVAQPARPPIEIAVNQAEATDSLEKTFRNAGMSAAGIRIVMAELGGSGPTAAQQAASEKVLAGMRRLDAAVAHPSPNAKDIVDAAREGRAATRAMIDSLAHGREQLMLQLSPGDLKIYLGIIGGIDTKLLLGMF